jgi:dTDP-4-amino-4,6-dideoxygalactose transaminase
METLCALIRGDLSPAGYPISTVSFAIEDKVIAGDYHHSWVDSGTSALALALIDCKSAFAGPQKPQVIIPGYCCPDLVAAAVFAGVEPLAVDISENDAAYDLDQLEDAIIQNPNVIAVIAVNFLGIKENRVPISQMLTNRGIKLIEDNAQWFPVSQEDQHFGSDYVVFSFGRGKPLSLLGGGLLLSRFPLAVSSIKSGNTGSAFYKLKVVAYNTLLHPNAYCFLNRAPFLKLGDTRFHALDKMESMPMNARTLFNANRELYIKRDESVINQYQSSFATIQMLKGIKSDRKGKLLRYPLLLSEPSRRDVLVEQLQTNGLGVSVMYQRELNRIEGVEGKVKLFSPLTNAKSFSERLLTLPVHIQVREKHLKKIKEIVLSNQ